jgi:hypothetical protein
VAKTGAGSRQPYPDEIREAAREAARDPDLSAAQIRRWLAAEHEAAVPMETVSRWVRLARAELEPQSIGDLSDRILSLLAADLRRIQAQPVAKLDLDRLAKVAATLKSLDGLKRKGPAAAKLKTLSDLNDSEAEEPKAFPLSDAPSVRDLERLG